jgi:DNA polymerase-3 subunit alpha
MGDFVHLHNHSDYSLQDAAATIDGLVKAAVEDGMDALALTDHGAMFGISKFYKVCKANGIKPIIGMEAYIVMDGSRFDRGKKNPPVAGGPKRKRYNHLILLAKNETGYKNLMKLSSIGYLEGFYYRPRIDMEVLTQYHEGLICTTACASGPVAAPLIQGDYQKAKDTAIMFRELFGDDFYLEIQDHGLDDEKWVLEGMPKLSKELGIKMIATNDIHYVKQDHSVAHNILLHLGDRTGNVNYRELRYRTDQIYFKTTEEMKDLFGKYEGAIENTLEIADKINFDFDFSKFYYPKFPIPKDSPAQTLDDYFELLAEEGLRKRFKEITPKIRERFDYEIDVIKSMGYSGYFLIVQDFINASKERGIPVGPGRGSAAGSIVAYALAITNVNPLDYDLLFERFLNPARKSMPDIDVDFADDQRGEAIEYVTEKYGRESVCQIVTFNRLSSKAVLKDVARVLQIPIPVVEKITKFIPTKFGKVFSIEKALNEVPELKWVKESKDEKIHELIKYPKILEGMNRNLSKHAAGVVIAPEDVSNFVPLAKYGTNGDIVTQYNMKELEDHGLLKMDFLGLRTLSIIRDTLRLIKMTHGIDLDIDTIPIDDKKTYELFGKGQTTAVFQFESAPMREYLKKLKPSRLEDLVAMNALYRPGPMENIDSFIRRKHGKEKIEYLHPNLEPILSTTYGYIVYQEQVIQIANKIAGMTLAEADILRRAMGKKQLEAMKEQKVKFVESAEKNGVKKQVAEKIFDDINKFANYGFNKSHAVAYSLVAYQTAYLKAHFLPEFLAANLSNEFGNTDKVTNFLEDCRKLKVEVLPPDVNKPSVKFSVDNGKIIFGMSAIKNVGEKAVVEIERARKDYGKDFETLFEFCTAVDTHIVNKRVLEGLVLAGAFDKLKGNRAEIFYSIESAIDFSQKVRNFKEKFDDGLFGGTAEVENINEPELEKVRPWERSVELEKEREVLGFYLTGHPLRDYEKEYYAFSTVHLGDPSTFKNDEERVRVCVVITGLSTKIDRSGKEMAFMKFDDLTGSCEAIMFGRDFAKHREKISKGATVLAMGKIESSGDSIKLQIDDVIPMEEVKKELTKTIIFKIDSDFHDENTIKDLKAILDKYPGKAATRIFVLEDHKKREFVVDVRVDPDDKLFEEVSELLGENSILFALN